jgi:hypothetical protein
MQIKKKKPTIDPELKFSLTTLTEFLNKNFEKTCSRKFTTSDVQGYIKRKALPAYLTPEVQINIVKFENDNFPKSKLYSLSEIEIKK